MSEEQRPPDGTLSSDQPVNGEPAVDADETSSAPNTLPTDATNTATRSRGIRDRTWRIAAYWLNLVLQPILVVIGIVMLAVLFGYAQRNLDWFNNAEIGMADENANEDSLYACTMLCVFVKAPGRCPVCGMALQLIDVPGDPKDLFGVTIKPASRRLANIRTIAAMKSVADYELEALGQITYDETGESTVSAYIDGRIEELFVDFTGAQVKKGDELALLYSPDLYAAQAALLDAKKAIDTDSGTRQRIADANQRLYESSRRRLLEFGLPKAEVDAMEVRGKPESRIKIYSPISGTVVKKMIDEGKYVKTGTPIFRIADLTRVWLLLEMFPEDAAKLSIGRPVSVSIQSQPGKRFEGQIAFLDPTVDRQTQTVTVRVVLSNDAGLIRIGDFGRARIKIGGDLEPQVIVPRESVLINGDDSVAYVETEPGRFEFRKVKIAKILGDKVAIETGIRPGEMVVASGALMLDSTFNMQGKVSLIDPDRAIPKNEKADAESAAEQLEIQKALEKLTLADRKLAVSQEVCPIAGNKLGANGMGTPVKIDLKGEPVFVCCEGCRAELLETPQKHLDFLERYQRQKSNPDQTETARIPSETKADPRSEMELLK